MQNVQQVILSMPDDRKMKLHVAYLGATKLKLHQKISPSILLTSPAKSHQAALYSYQVTVDYIRGSHYHSLPSALKSSET